MKTLRRTGQGGVECAKLALGGNEGPELEKTCLPPKKELKERETEPKKRWGRVEKGVFFQQRQPNQGSNEEAP